MIVTLRADIIGFRSPIADAEIVQNGYFADGERVFDVPHWPQPGLIPRNPERGATIRTLAFKGDRGNLHPDLFSSRFADFLDARDIAVHLEETDDRTVPQPWHDYQNVDLLIAVRKPWHEGDMFYNKPATKLINAWHAGVPALLGPEYAFRELREDPLDYIEVASDEDAMAAIDRLIEHPDLYRDMVAHGRKRAEDFTIDRITERWAEVLFEKIPRIANTQSFQLSRALPLSARRGLNMSLMPPTPHEMWKMGGHLYRTLRNTTH
jgi:glycosyltransferase involved in cell wall biosynthesis